MLSNLSLCQSHVEQSESCDSAGKPSLNSYKLYKTVDHKKTVFKIMTPETKNITQTEEKSGGLYRTGRYFEFYQPGNLFYFGWLKIEQNSDRDESSYCYSDSVMFNPLK